MKLFDLLLLTLVLIQVQAQRSNLRPKTSGDTVEAEKPRETRQLGSSTGEHNGELRERDRADTKRFVVKYRNAAGKDDVLQKASQVHKVLADDEIVVEMTAENLDMLEKDDNVERIEEDVPWVAQGFLDGQIDPAEARILSEEVPYGISMIQADQLDIGPHPVKVCVVDTGLAVNHPDIDSSRVTGEDRTSSIESFKLKWDLDKRGHGTHIAGTIAAKIGNNEGVRGVGDIDLFITRGLTDQGTAFQSDILEAVKQCRNDRDVKIISMSLGGKGIIRSLYDLYTELSNEGYLIVGAAGNSGKEQVNYPASHPNVISVSAITSQKKFWAYSNYGKWIEIAAPGYRIYSTVVNSNGYGYAHYSGTSMAAPHVAGAAALLWSHFKDCTNHQIRYALAYTAADLGSGGCDSTYGYGLVQVKAAYDFLSTHSCADANWGQTPSTGECSTIDEEPVVHIPTPSPVRQRYRPTRSYLGFRRKGDDHSSNRLPLP